MEPVSENAGEAPEVLGGRDRGRRAEVELPAGVFADRLHRGVTPARIRAKLYRIHSDIIEQRCAALGVEFLSPPAEAADAEGFLKPAYWTQDPTHANRAYGALLLKQIEERLAA